MADSSNFLTRKIYPYLAQRWVYHGLIWGVYVLLLILLNRGQQTNIAMIIQQTIVHLLFVMVVVYINYQYLLPTYLLQKKYVQFLLAAIALTIVVAPLELVVLYWGLSDYPSRQTELLQQQTGHFVLFFVMILLSTTIKIIKDWIRQQRVQQELERKTLQSELSFLKSQINPHFLFNTLNSIYALTLKKSEKAPEVVLQLSEMMRYMLYRSDEKKVSLLGEIQYIQNYLALEKLRYGNKAQIEFECHIEQPDQYLIAPLLLIPFLENSFKHGLSQSIAVGTVTCMLFVEQLEDKVILDFTLQNSKTTERDIRYIKGGIGLVNVRRRLELIYPNQYQLEIEETEALYLVNLQLEL